MAFDDDGPGPQLIEAVFVPRGAEERAVRKGLARARASLLVVPTGIGPLAAVRAAEDAVTSFGFKTALCTGLCGLLSPAFAVGDVLIYHQLVAEDRTPLVPERQLGDAVAARVPGSQSGIRAFGSSHILTTAEQKRAAAARFGADAVDMESFALVERLQRAGIAVAVARVASDAVGDDLPELDRALDGSGGLDGFALALAMLRQPRRGARLALRAVRALGRLERAVASIAAAA